MESLYFSIDWGIGACTRNSVGAGKVAAKEIKQQIPGGLKPARQKEKSWLGEAEQVPFQSVLNPACCNG